MACTIYAIVISEVFQLRVGPLGIEGYYLFAYLVNKPWVKMNFQSLGILFGFAYWDLLQYRKLASVEEK